MAQSDFDRLVGRLDYPMVIVTAADGVELSGCLVGFHTQCSIEPPRFLVCVSRRNHTHAVALRSELLGVHFLDAANYPLSELFGERTGDDTDKFAACSWTPRHGVPILTDPPGWLLGRVRERMELGDHTGFVLEPIEAALTGELRQLAFQRVKTMKPGHPAG
jgi:flavin reductase (DIM6/NTAB) family NADH-FMN oxidoreductase RutF